MTKKNWFLAVFVLVLAGVYVFYFTDWFKPKIIHLASTNARNIRAGRARRSNGEAVTVPVLFKLARPYKLTEIKVVALEDWQTNKNTMLLWHLVADTNSVPISQPFAYGQRIPGMKPALTGMRAKPLQAGDKYRIFVTAGPAEGHLDFQPIAKTD